MASSVNKIIAVAIKQNDKIYSLVAPNRHHNVMDFMIEQGVEPPIQGVQGFLASDGSFIDRKEAYKIATNSGQIKERSRMKELFSEDLW